MVYKPDIKEKEEIKYATENELQKIKEELEKIKEKIEGDKP